MADAENSPPPPVPPLDLAAAGRLVGALRHDEQDEETDAAQRQLPRIRGFKPRRWLGAGGGGVVFEAAAEGTGQRVAIKLLSGPAGRPARFPGAAPVVLGSGGDGSGGGARRAWRELDLLSQLRLAAIPRVIDYGLHQGRLYIVTEYVEGVPLDEFCGVAADVHPARAPLPLSQRVARLATVADAVQSLHEHGVIHRDLKPSNILIDRRGEPVIVDLGIATLLSGDAMATLTADGAPIGTPAFMAPEQARGERDAVSTRSDVYALGATACLILTGRTPHDLSAVSTPSLAAAVQRVAHEPPRDPFALDPTLPPELGTIIAKATDPRPERRYASAGALAEDLRRWLRGEPVLASAPTPWTATARWISRHPLITTAAACAVMLATTAAAIVATTYYLAWTPRSLRTDAGVNSRVELVAANGQTLAEWDGGGQGSVLYADFLRDVRGRRDGLVLIGWDMNADHPHAGRLCAYDPREPHSPVWVRGVGDVDLAQPTPSPDGYPNAFRLGLAHRADVFPQRDGEEIIAVFIHHPWSPSAILVYDAAGEPLYEVWHDGQLADLRWLPGPRLLVATGANCDQRLDDLGYPPPRDAAGEPGAVWPEVVFAVEPSEGAKLGFLRTPDGIGDVPAAWYRFILPPDASAAFAGSPRLAPPPPNFDRDRHVRLTLTAPSGAGVALVVDESGAIVHRYAADTYAHDAAVPLEALELADRIPPPPPPRPASEGDPR